MAVESAKQLVGILDAGSQFGKVIDRKVRELCVESELIANDTPVAELAKYKCLIISGGPDSVYNENSPVFDPALFDMGIPILGICYGMQLMVHRTNEGKIERKKTREDGQFNIILEKKSLLFSDLDTTQKVLLTHGDSVTAAGDGFVVTSRSATGIISSIEDVERKLYGVQFHPEVDLTVNGKKILSNFLYQISDCSPTFTIEDREEIAIRYIHEVVGDKKVLCLVSGGVDSSVCAALLRKALPVDQIYAVHVDSGFMRLNESSSVATALANAGVNCTVVQAEEIFANSTTNIDGEETQKLCEVVAPEVKRKIIGDTFVHIANNQCKVLGLSMENVILAQGTLRPDLIESASSLANASGTAEVIKTHHNDTQLVRDLRARGMVVEPLKDYHKDEVRQLGRQLGLPQELVMRQPFPGPGLAIRIICINEPYLTEEDGEILIQLENLEKEYPDLAFALHGFRTVGVQGDGRSYKHCVNISSKTKEPQDWPKIFELAKSIPNNIHGVNRIIFSFGPPVSGHLPEITETYLLPEVVSLCREADAIVNDLLHEHNLTVSLSQVPVVLFPCGYGNSGERSICIRTFITNDFMTGVPALIGEDIPVEVVELMAEKVSKINGIARVCYDLTPKPPGTTEWE